MQSLLKPPGAMVKTKRTPAEQQEEPQCTNLKVAAVAEQVNHAQQQLVLPPAKLAPEHHLVETLVQTDDNRSPTGNSAIVQSKRPREPEEEFRRPVSSPAFTRALLAAALQEQTKPTDTFLNYLIGINKYAKRPSQGETQTSDSQTLASASVTAAAKEQTAAFLNSAAAAGANDASNPESTNHSNSEPSNNSQDDALVLQNRKPTQEEMLMALQHHWNVLYKGGQVSTAFPTSMLPPSLGPSETVQLPPSDGKSIMAVRPAKKKRKVAAHQHYKDLATKYLKKAQTPPIPEVVLVPSDFRIDDPEYLVRCSPKKKSKSVRFATQDILGLATATPEAPLSSNKSTNSDHYTLECSKTTESALMEAEASSSSSNAAGPPDCFPKPKGRPQEVSKGLSGSRSSKGKGPTPTPACLPSDDSLVVGIFSHLSGSASTGSVGSQHPQLVPA